MEPYPKEVRCNLAAALRARLHFPLFGQDISQAKAECLYALVRVRPAVLRFLRCTPLYPPVGVFSAASWQYITPRLFMCLKIKSPDIFS